MATLEFGPEGTGELSLDGSGPWDECVERNLLALADDPTKGRVAPSVPFGWWAGLIFDFHCDSPDDGRAYFTAFYLKSKTGVRVESLGINRG